MIPDERDQMASERKPHWPETMLDVALRRLDELERRVQELEGTVLT